MSAREVRPLNVRLDDLMTCDGVGKEAKRQTVEDVRALTRELVIALRYARRWLNKDEHDLTYIDGVLAQGLALQKGIL